MTCVRGSLVGGSVAVMVVTLSIVLVGVIANAFSHTVQR